MSTRKELELRVQELLEAEGRYIARVRELEMALRDLALRAEWDAQHIWRDVLGASGRKNLLPGAQFLLPGEPEPRDQRSNPNHLPQE